MSDRGGQYYVDVLSGRERGAWASVLRAAATIAEPGYGAIVAARNLLYDWKLPPAHRLPRPAISVGNLTTGGTGKTPLVVWLAKSLVSAGRKPAVLLRGYKSVNGISDEAALIGQAAHDIPVVADADRRRGAARVVAAHPDVDLFILDDAMQHRRIRRNVEIVVISAINPWGLGHLLPRGLLREPIAGLRRADAIVITHCSESASAHLEVLEATVRRHNAGALIVRTDHILSGVASALADKPYWAACGIGQPEGFLSSLNHCGGRRVGQTIYGDHHAYTDQDVTELRKQAAAAKAAAIVVTEKDWTKLSRLGSTLAVGIPFLPAKLDLQFAAGAAARLLDLVVQRSKPA